MMLIFRDKTGHRWAVEARNLGWHLRWLVRIGRL